ncbi:MAG: bifunctional diaminohydroxyphosphoribosylaminopyrimidine deaminase/5-amino-6-(5-phosphoribosylamino)uracil reductase RibD [Lacipirellulaceae bacterium]
MNGSSASDAGPYDEAMARALRLATRGEGLVEPNPMVGCVVLARDGIVGEGWHERFGEAHAEVNAMRGAGERARGATLVVTLEPCCHTGKTPPCVDAVLAAGIARVVVAVEDPFPRVAGGGLAALRAAGIECVVGVGANGARDLLAPYLRLTTQGLPWTIAKWAMTLDGKIATHSGDSQWISGPESRAAVHRLRSRVDAIVVGAGTLAADDPLLTARLPGGEAPRRVATRVVVAGDRPLPTDRKLWASAGEAPVLVAVRDAYPEGSARELSALGVEVLRADVPALWREMGARRWTNVLVEGGAGLLGDLFDAGLIDEVQAFVAPALIGGAAAPSPVRGAGCARIADALRLAGAEFERLGDDFVVRGRVRR